MAPLIRAVLSNLIGEEAASEIQIIANDVKVFPDGKWDIQFRHPSRWEGYHAICPYGYFIELFQYASGFGHDKSQAILPYRELAKPPMLFFFGDGVSGSYPQSKIYFYFYLRVISFL